MDELDRDEIVDSTTAPQWFIDYLGKTKGYREEEARAEWQNEYSRFVTADGESTHTLDTMYRDWLHRCRQEHLPTDLNNVATAVADSAAQTPKSGVRITVEGADTDNPVIRDVLGLIDQLNTKLAQL